jgi:hypothetical protein
MADMQLEARAPLSVTLGFCLAMAPLVAPRAFAAGAALDLTCSGNSYASTGDPFPTPETVAFKWDGKKSVTVTVPGGDGPTAARIVSSNPIQLKFSAGAATGEYFNFSGDLFLIHKDGRFTRLVCKPRA